MSSHPTASFDDDETTRLRQIITSKLFNDAIPTVTPDRTRAVVDLESDSESCGASAYFLRASPTWPEEQMLNSGTMTIVSDETLKTSTPPKHRAEEYREESSLSRHWSPIRTMEMEPQAQVPVETLASGSMTVTSDATTHITELTTNARRRSPTEDRENPSLSYGPYGTLDGMYTNVATPSPRDSPNDDIDRYSHAFEIIPSRSHEDRPRRSLAEPYATPRVASAPLDRKRSASPKRISHISSRRESTTTYERTFPPSAIKSSRTNDNNDENDSQVVVTPQRRGRARSKSTSFKRQQQPQRRQGRRRRHSSCSSRSKQIGESRCCRTVVDEVNGCFDDVLSSFDQVFNVFTLQDKDIRAVTGRIAKAKRQFA